jgi:hypothetical protein
MQDNLMPHAIRGRVSKQHNEQKKNTIIFSRSGRTGGIEERLECIVLHVRQWWFSKHQENARDQ